MPAAQNTPDRKIKGIETNAFKIIYISLESLITRGELPKTKVQVIESSIPKETLKTIVDVSTKTDRPNLEDEVKNTEDLNVYKDDSTTDPVSQIKTTNGDFGAADMEVFERRLSQEESSRKGIKADRDPGFNFQCYNPFKFRTEGIFDGQPGSRGFFTFYCILIITLSTSMACVLTIPNSDWADVKGLQASFISSRNQLMSSGNDLKPKNADSWDILYLRSVFLKFCFPLEAMIHFGAIYSPCFYPNPLPINVNISAERDTGCCVENKKINGSYVACFQSDESRCRDTNFDFVKYKNSIGPVCGRDPEYCTSPSRDSFDKEDITKWEPCSKTRNVQNITHMNCKVILRPCCLLTLNCAMYDEKQCQENEGTFHTDKAFCSQVNCFKEYCGSFFLRPLWRLFISPFLSAGLPHYFFLIIMLAGQLLPIETYYGTRVAMQIYLVPAFIDNVSFIYFYPNFPSLSAIAPMVCLITFLLVEVILKSRENLKLFINLFSSGFGIGLHFALLPHIKLSQIGLGFVVGLIMSCRHIRKPKQKERNANKGKSYDRVSS